MKGLRLYKSEKLCSRTAVNSLFAGGASASFIAYPLRIVYGFQPQQGQSAAPAQFLITIPKRKVRHAVGRVLLRRRVREAYRLCRRELLHPALRQAGLEARIAFVYLDGGIASYDTISQHMQAALERIAQAAASASQTNEEGR